MKRAVKAALYSAIPQEAWAKYYVQREFVDRNFLVLLGRAVFSIIFIFYVYTLTDLAQKTHTFVEHCHSLASSMANPKVVSWGYDRYKGRVKVDDYWKGYQWMKEHTPEDARIIAWWDYGYQITGIANRTSIADGNTWNHEHIATLGRTLTSPEKKAWNA